MKKIAGGIISFAMVMAMGISSYAVDTGYADGTLTLDPTKVPEGNFDGKMVTVLVVPSNVTTPITGDDIMYVDQAKDGFSAFLEMKPKDLANGTYKIMLGGQGIDQPTEVEFTVSDTPVDPDPDAVLDPELTKVSAEYTAADGVTKVKDHGYCADVKSFNNGDEIGMTFQYTAQDGKIMQAKVKYDVTTQITGATVQFGFIVQGVPVTVSNFTAVPYVVRGGTV